MLLGNTLHLRIHLIDLIINDITHIHLRQHSLSYSDDIKCVYSYHIFTLKSHISITFTLWVLSRLPLASVSPSHLHMTAHFLPSSGLQRYAPPPLSQESGSAGSIQAAFQIQINRIIPSADPAAER